MSSKDTIALPAWTGPLLVFVPMALVLSINLSFVWLSRHDPGFAVVPDYHARGLAWDAEAERRRRSEALGFELTLMPLRLEGRRFELLASLKDADGEWMPDATLTVEAFAVSRASEVLTLTVREDGLNRVARFDANHGGLWEFRCTVRRGEDRWYRSIRHELPPLEPR